MPKDDISISEAGVSWCERGECYSETHPTVLPAVCHCPLRPLSLHPYHIYSQPTPPVHYPMSRSLSGSTCMLSNIQKWTNARQYIISQIKQEHRALFFYYYYHYRIGCFRNGHERWQRDGHVKSVHHLDRSWTVINSTIICRHEMFESLMAAVEKWVSCKFVQEISSLCCSEVGYYLLFCSCWCLWHKARLCPRNIKASD